MKLTISHETVYRYDHSVRHSTQYLRLTPRTRPGQKILSWHLDTPAQLMESTDAFGNILHVLTLDKPHDEIRLRAVGVVETEGEDMGGEADHLSPLIFLRATELTEADDAIGEFANQYAAAVNANRRAGLTELMSALLAHMPYEKGSTSATTTAAEAFAQGSGVCQDHTHVFLAACRSLGIPARYVSGYLFTDDSEHVASHAWAEAWLGDCWFGFDVSNQCHPHARHLKLAVGMDYLDACPVRGVRMGGGGEAMQAHAKVQQINE